MDDNVKNNEMQKESTIFGMSLRGIIALIIVVTACSISAYGNEIKEPLYTVFIAAVSYYFGQKTSK